MQQLLTLLVLDDALRVRRFQLALLLFGLILAIGSIPGARADLGQLASGLVLHALAYGAIAFLLYTGSAGSRRQRAARAVLTVMAMGAADELLQSLLPYRVGTLLDWVVDSSAALVCASLLAVFLPDPVTRSQP